MKMNPHLVMIAQKQSRLAELTGEIDSLQKMCDIIAKSSPSEQSVQSVHFCFKYGETEEQVNKTEMPSQVFFVPRTASLETFVNTFGQQATEHLVTKQKEKQPFIHDCQISSNEALLIASTLLKSKRTEWKILYDEAISIIQQFQTQNTSQSCQ